MSDQAWLGIFKTGKDRELGINKGSLESQNKLLCFRIGDKYLEKQEIGIIFANKSSFKSGYD